jgi:gliding motility-associated protein GldM
MNVLYRGVLNPIEVSAAGIQDSKVHISVSNGTLSKTGGQYMVNPGDGTTCEVGVVAEIDGEKKNMGKKIFRVKSVPKPEPEIDGVKGRSATRQQLQAAQGIRAMMPPDFDFEMKFTIKSFMVLVPVDGYIVEEKSTSMMFNDKQKKIMGKLSTGQRLSITEIIAVGPDGKDVELADLGIKVR